MIIISKSLKLMCFCWLFLSCSIVDYGYIISERTNSVGIPSTNAIQDLPITSPENKTYVQMIGYYPGTYGFENDQIGSTPNGWIPGGIGGNPWVIASMENHKRVVEMHDVDTHEINMQNDIEPQESGTVEWWWRTSDASKGTDFLLVSSGNTAVGVEMNYGYFRYETSSWINLMPCSSGTWHHLRIDFDCSLGGTGQYNLTIDNKLILTNQEFTNPAAHIDRVWASTSTSSSGYYVYLDAISYSWDPYYDIGDNNREGLLVSYDVTRIYNWVGYSLDRQTNRTITGNTVIKLPSLGNHSIQVFGRDTSGIIHASEPIFFKIVNFQITTPEAMDYTAAMNGYFPATYGFEEDSIGSANGEISWVDNDETAENITVIGKLDGHNSVMQLNDKSSTSKCSAIHNSIQTCGTWEFWFRTTDVSKRSDFVIYGGGENPTPYVIFRIDHYDWIKNIDGNWDVMNIRSPENNKWYHIQIDFRCDGAPPYKNLLNDCWRLYIDNYGGSPLTPCTTSTSVSQLRFETDSTHKDYALYVDAVGLSWDTTYDLGDNWNEGLLLSFKTSVTPNWMGYSLDSKPYMTIRGNTTLKLPEDGIHSITIQSILNNGEFVKSKNVTFSISTNSLTEPIPPQPSPYLDWIFIWVIPGIFGIACVVTIFIMFYRVKAMQRIPKKKTPLQIKAKTSLLCPYCHTKIDLKSNYCPYCNSKVNG